MYPAMRNREFQRSERRAAAALAVQRPLLPALALPARYFLGLGLMLLCLWMPAFAALFWR